MYLKDPANFDNRKGRRSSKVEGEKEGEEGPLLTEEGATDSAPL